MYFLISEIFPMQNIFRTMFQRKQANLITENFPAFKKYTKLILRRYRSIKLNFSRVNSGEKSPPRRILALMKSDVLILKGLSDFRNYSE